MWVVMVVLILLSGIFSGLTLGLMGWTNQPLEMFSLLIGSVALGLAVDDTIHFMHNGVIHNGMKVYYDGAHKGVSTAHMAQ